MSRFVILAADGRTEIPAVSLADWDHVIIQRTGMWKEPVHEPLFFKRMTSDAKDNYDHLSLNTWYCAGEREQENEEGQFKILKWHPESPQTRKSHQNTIIQDQQTVGKTENIYCNECMDARGHEQLTAKRVRFTDAGEGLEYTAEAFYCTVCKVPLFRLKTDLRGSKWEEIFPARGFKVKEFTGLNATLKALYREIILSYNNRLYLACTGVIRAFIEGLCKEKGIHDGPVTDRNGKTSRRSDLQGKIEGLVEKQIVTRTNADILHEQRYMGNAALHELQPPTQGELRVSIQVLEHTIGNVYTLAELADNFRRLRNTEK